MPFLNKMEIIGHLGANPEWRTSPGKPAFLSFRVAVNEPFRTEPTGPVRELTTWVVVSCRGELAEKCAATLRRGTQVFVVGRVAPNAWLDEERNLRSALSLSARHVQALGGPPSTEPALREDEAADDEQQAA